MNLSNKSKEQLSALGTDPSATIERAIQLLYELEVGGGKAIVVSEEGYSGLEKLAQNNNSRSTDAFVDGVGRGGFTLPNGSTIMISMSKVREL